MLDSLHWTIFHVKQILEILSYFYTPINYACKKSYQVTDRMHFHFSFQEKLVHVMILQSSHDVVCYPIIDC